MSFFKEYEMNRVDCYCRHWIPDPILHKSTLRKGILLCVIATTVFMVHFCYMPASPKFVQAEIPYWSTERWIVIDGTENRWTNDIKELPGWKILIFADAISSRSRQSCKTCVFIHKNTTLNFEGIDTLNVKMLSYVYVIRSGARWIYSTNTSADLEEQVRDFHLEDTADGLMYTGKVMFDPSIHFGEQGVSQSPDKERYTVYQLGQYMTPVIQRKWQPGSTTTDELLIMCKLPPAFVPAHLAPSFSIVRTLIHYSAFWILGGWFTKMNVTQTGTWQNSLLSRINGLVGIYTPPCDSKFVFALSKGQHSGLKLSETIENKTPEKFRHAVYYLTGRLTGSGISLKIMTLWLDILQKLHYTFPVTQNTVPSFPKELSGRAQKTIYEPHVKINVPFGNPFVDMCNDKYRAQRKVGRIDDILLVIFFSDPHFYSNIIYLDFLYRKFFTHIVYCGPGIDEFLTFYRTYSHPVTFIDGFDQKGYFPYTSVSSAIGLGFHVRGYLEIADDVLFNAWTITELPRNKVWFQNSLRNATFKSTRVPGLTPGETDWYWWNSWNGIMSLSYVFAELKSIHKVPYVHKIQRFFNLLQLNLGYKEDGVFYEASDIFYVPRRLADDFRYFSQLFYENRVFLEIAVPTILCSLSNLKNIVFLNGTYLWLEDRMYFAQVYNPMHTFIHAFKLSLLKQQKVKDFYCGTYLSDFENQS